MTEIRRKTRVIDELDPERIPYRELLESRQPAILKGVAKDWEIAIGIFPARRMPGGRKRIRYPAPPLKPAALILLASIFRVYRHADDTEW